MSSEFQYEQEFNFALALVRKVSQIFLPAFFSIKDVSVKDFASDLVTNTDKAIEDVIFAEIRRQYPADNRIGEESAQESAVFDDRRTWIVDPIDGTTNFVHRNPDCCICVGFTVDKTPQFGVVYCPVLEDLYSARRGHGAHLNGHVIRVSGRKNFNEAMLSTYFNPSISMGLSEAKQTLLAMYSVPVYNKMSDDAKRTKREGNWQGCRGLRMGGSSATMMCHVAAGHLDAFYHEGLHIWDMAAAVAIAREAGATVTSTCVGQEFDLTLRCVVVACSENVAREIQCRTVKPPPGLFRQEPAPFES